ncbi:3'-5' exonuclease [[Leptolyngbya] sp. PCC 7376]|uniref:3'-5' exonuclease n=1 Tax=[Leptolyngbya] sp. PCC 7376 TaxID=111781 RepID=UPI0005A12729|nr:3'-5' exonuclease [[Leptolyngbya] sp. PCC 7376]
MEIDQDYYLIIDLEATCCDDKSIPRHKMEIIEIGAVLLHSKTLEIESEYQTFVQPILNPTLTDFCKTLTSITQGDVNQAPHFPEAIQGLQKWLYPFRSYVFCSWGKYDKTQFERDCQRHNVDYPFPSKHINLKKSFSAIISSSKKFGMNGALEKLGLPLIGTHHRGIDDARNIARIVQALKSKTQES